MPGLAVLLEGALAAEDARVGIDVLVFDVAELGRPLLSVEFVEQRLGVPGFEMRGAARHVDEDEGLGFGLVGHVRRLGGERIVAGGAGLRFRHHSGEGHGAHAAEAVGEKFPPVARKSNVFGHISSRKGKR